MKKNNQSAQWNMIMNISPSFLGFPLLVALLSPSLMAADLQAFDVAALPGDRVELKLTFDEPVLAPRGYTIEQPARIALDLPGVSNKLGVKNKELGVGNARSVTVVEAKDRTRLIVNLTNLSPYSTRSEGNSVFVVIGEGGNNTAASALPVAPAVSVAAKKYVPQANAISNRFSARRAG
jgi:type IV pilus assembly protein PilQ